MIKAELIHNPYLLETTVRFNGKEPRINCQIEKYENQALNMWVERIPEIFYNEMNGYDFELLFTGTRPDYEAVRRTFRKAGVTSEEVQITHKNELEDAYKKSEEIMQFLGWLADNRNKRFDYDHFREEYASFFDDPYPFIIVNGKNAQIDGIPISVDTVSTVGELQNTDLINTPIVFYIDNTKVPSRRSEIECLLNRDDVVKEQLFFFMSQELTALQKERATAELGIDNPQIIYSFEDESLKMYMEYYPITEYIRASIQLFRKISSSISEELAEANRRSVVVNESVHNEIAKQEEIISSLKAAEDFYVGRDNFIFPEEILAEERILFESIAKWKSKRTKVVGEVEIERMATLLQAEVKTRFENYVSSVRDMCIAKADEIKEKFTTRYRELEEIDRYEPAVGFKRVYMPTYPEITDEIMKLKEITYVEKPKDFLGGLFKKADSESSEPQQIITAYLDQWRKKTYDLIMPLAIHYMDEYAEKLALYYNELARGYGNHLHSLLMNNREKKEKTATQLSGDERLLQIDNDWYAAFADQLEHIERG